MPDRFQGGPARPSERWLPKVEISAEDKRLLKAAAVPVQFPETMAAIERLLAIHEKGAIVRLLNAIADDVYTLENPPPFGSWWRRALWHLDKSGIRDNYIFQGRLRRLAASIAEDLEGQS